VVSFIIVIYNPNLTTDYKVVPDGYSEYNINNDFTFDDEFDGEIVKEGDPIAKTLLGVWVYIDFIRILIFVYLCMGLYKTYRQKLEGWIIKSGDLDMIDNYFILRYDYLLFLKNCKRWFRW